MFNVQCSTFNVHSEGNVEYLSKKEISVSKTNEAFPRLVSQIHLNPINRGKLNKPRNARLIPKNQPTN